MPNGVVLVHGILRTYRSMNGLARYLKKQDFEILNIGYPSTRYPIEQLIEIIHPEINNFANSLDARIHFVGFSMGALVIRAYLHKYRPHNLGRAVMIGPPNNGSEVADFVQSWGIYKFLYGPAGQQLITNQESFNHHLGKVDYELGVIAGCKSIDPISSYIIGKPNDGKVSIESTKLEGIKSHLVLPTSHTFFPLHRRTWKNVEYFLKNGTFNDDTLKL